MSELSLGPRISASRLGGMSQQLPLISTAVVCAVLCMIGSICYAGFFTAQNFSNFFGSNAVLGVASIGLTFVILSGGIDLSVGSMIGFTSILVGVLVERYHWSPAAAIPLVLLVGCAFGFINGCLIQGFELAPFLVTLAGMFVARGLALSIAPVSGRVALVHAAFKWPSEHSLMIGEGPLRWGMMMFSANNPLFMWPSTRWAEGGVEVRLISIFFIAVSIVAGLVLRYTRFGRNVFAIGGSEPSAMLMGLPVGSNKIFIYTISGFCSALAGLVSCFDLLAGDPTASLGLELDAIAAVVIGGTLLSGGVGSIAGTVLGVLILAMIQTGLDFDGRLISWWTRIVIGGLLLMFIALQKTLTRVTAAR